MKRDQKNARQLRIDAKEALTLFARGENGSMTVFACFMILIMLMIGGIGVDLMRNEMERTRLQAVADRAVLAAADMDQTIDAEAVVRDYFEKSGLGEHVANVVIDPGANYRIVTVDAGSSMNTQFMHSLGVATLPVYATATAEERVPKVEISLVLDISGSMRFSGRMDALRPAATNFINTVLKGNDTAKTSVTLVPYAGQTNPGPFMFNRLNGNRYDVDPLDEDMGGIPEALSHGLLPAGAAGGEGSDENVRYVYPNVSSCLDIGSDGFSTASLPSGALYPQTAHFMNWNIAAGVMDWGWCPQDQTSIRYLQNDADALNGLITNMRMHDGTGTHYAMKWAVAMLDPSSRSDVTALINAGLAAPDFAGRPADYSDDETVKYIVLMTDGQITEQVRPIDTMHTKNPTKELNNRTSDRERITNASTNIGSFFEQCNLAKQMSPRGIVIYTIAFEAPGTPEQQMKDCATSESHFFAADGASISNVFQAIARQINQLRLTQ